MTEHRQPDTGDLDPMGRRPDDREAARLEPDDPGFADLECVEPGLGARLDAIDDETADGAFRRALRHHLLICDACRLRQAARQRIAAGLQDGTYRLPGSDEAVGRQHRPPRWSAWLALAACLALVFILPPRPRQDAGPGRGADATGFVRPVEGERILAGGAELTWRPVAEASAYRLSVTSTDGAYRWEQTARTTRATVPAARPLPPHTRFLAVLEPVPADLGPAGGIAVSFATASPAAVLWYRLRAAPPALQVLLPVALVLALTLTLRRRPVRPRA